jgi:hypothetical protein
VKYLDRGQVTGNPSPILVMEELPTIRPEPDLGFPHTPSELSAPSTDAVDERAVNGGLRSSHLFLRNVQDNQSSGERRDHQNG